jgi:glycosyltransferase involved in cell wall biosynthesis
MEIHEFKSNRINLVHVGSLTQEKNHFGLLEIFQIILEDCEDAHLHIIGEGPLKSGISKKIGELGLEHNISLHGEMKDPFRYIAQADVLLLPSLIEGLPAVILEAMYCKTPVVAYNVGGVAEIVNKHTGYLIEKGEQEAFKNAVLEILAARPEEKIENAYKMVKAEYMNEKIALKFEEVYRRLLE